VTSTAPGASAGGISATIDVVDRETILASVDPNCTVAFAGSRVPLMLSRPPPVTGPLIGETAEMPHIGVPPG
jgi:hypothetical protein